MPIRVIDHVRNWRFERTALTQFVGELMVQAQLDHPCRNRGGRVGDDGAECTRGARSNDRVRGRGDLLSDQWLRENGAGGQS